MISHALTLVRAANAAARWCKGTLGRIRSRLVELQRGPLADCAEEGVGGYRFCHVCSLETLHTGSSCLYCAQRSWGFAS